MKDFMDFVSRGMEAQRCVNDIVKEHDETEGNARFDKQRTPTLAVTVDAARLMSWLETLSNYTEIVVEDIYGAKHMAIVEAHRGPKTSQHPHGTFVLRVR